ncbi:MAG: hypothetical protein HZB56_10655 [Deltaproteobacteria bacterium]|nr:hypothetical protein [Deltaproteobacteria bacterium]
MTKAEIIEEIKAYVGNSGAKTWDEVYVGISKDARIRLFNGHGVSEARDSWILRQADSSEAAREVEEYFLKVLGADGGPGGGDDSADFVYAYRKAAHTNP